MAALPHKPPSLQPNHSAHGLTSSNPKPNQPVNGKIFTTVITFHHQTKSEPKQPHHTHSEPVPNSETKPVHHHHAVTRPCVLGYPSHAAVNPPLPSTPASSSSSLPSRASNRRCYHQQSAAAFNLSPSRLRRVRFLLRPVLKPASAQPLFLSPPPIIKAAVRTALAIDLPSSLQNLTTPSSPKSIKAAPP
ncbi:hypothetical protein M0R45_007111 [Rubus argutus]|uniref:Uncharacterized protein n=1 Tax=Rubus argutus TaxID=59490 RepID=A0AAW1YSI3_RUBAR